MQLCQYCQLSCVSDLPHFSYWQWQSLRIGCSKGLDRCAWHGRPHHCTKSYADRSGCLHIHKSQYVHAAHRSGWEDYRTVCSSGQPILLRPTSTNADCSAGGPSSVFSTPQSRWPAQLLLDGSKPQLGARVAGTGSVCRMFKPCAANMDAPQNDSRELKDMHGTYATPRRRRVRGDFHTRIISQRIRLYHPDIQNALVLREQIERMKSELQSFVLKAEARKLFRHFLRVTRSAPASRGMCTEESSGASFWVIIPPVSQECTLTLCRRAARPDQARIPPARRGERPLCTEISAERWKDKAENAL